MTLVTPGPLQQVNMAALDLRRFVGVLVATEGVAGTADMTVAQRGAGANMSVDISTGEAYVQGDQVTNQGFYYALNDGTFNLTGFTAAHATLPRIDRVVLRQNDAFHGSANNTQSFAILDGVATSGATLANTTGATAPGNNELLLANVLVPATATTITTANIDTTGASNNSPPVRPRLVVAGTPTPPGTELTPTVAVTGAVTGGGSVVTIATMGAYTFDGLTAVRATISIPYVSVPGASQTNNIGLHVDGTLLCLTGSWQASSASAETFGGVFMQHQWTPAAGSHTISWRWQAGNALVAQAGAGTGGAWAPIFARLVKV